MIRWSSRKVVVVAVAVVVVVVVVVVFLSPVAHFSRAEISPGHHP